METKDFPAVKESLAVARHQLAFYRQMMEKKKAMKVRVVGLDPSLRSWGICRAELDVDTLVVDVMDFRLIETVAENSKQTRKNSDDIRRAQVLTAGLHAACPAAVVAFCEVPVGSQSARAMASYGLCVGVLGGCPVPLIELTPYEVKIAAVGFKTADKAEMIDWAMTKHPKAPWLMRGGKPVAKNEHLADALATIYAGVQTAQFATVLQMLRAHREAA